MKIKMIVTLAVLLVTCAFGCTKDGTLWGVSGQAAYTVDPICGSGFQETPNAPISACAAGMEHKYTKNPKAKFGTCVSNGCLSKVDPLVAAQAAERSLAAEEGRCQDGYTETKHQRVICANVGGEQVCTMIPQECKRNGTY